MIDGIKESKQEVGTSHVLYCAAFSHGLIKVGVTSDINRRLCELECHGLLSDLFIEARTVSCENKDPFSAESILISKCTEAFGEFHGGPEVFKTRDVDGVVGFMADAISEAPIKPNLEINLLEDLENPWQYLDIKNAHTYQYAILLATVIVNVILSFEKSPPKEWEDFMDNCSLKMLEALVFFMRRNTEMMEMNMSDQDRRESLMAEAKSYRFFTSN